jgi:16S rRNA (cytidine1402-2'-O)-methyltransferase
MLSAKTPEKPEMLLHHFEIKKPQISFREDNEQKALPKVMEHLRAGENVALVTDAGSPSISDPGYLLVRAPIAEGIPVSAIPGPTALIMALVFIRTASSFFYVSRFSPQKTLVREKSFFAVDAESPHTLIYYESPYG